LYQELNKARNFKPWMGKGLYVGTLMVGIEQKLFGGNVPWTVHTKYADHEYLKPADQCQKIDYLLRSLLLLRESCRAHSLLV
jgi:electron-transferring-flavoprotein dehydrogenase